MKKYLFLLFSITILSCTSKIDPVEKEVIELINAGGSYPVNVKYLGNFAYHLGVNPFHLFDFKDINVRIAPYLGLQVQWKKLKHYKRYKEDNLIGVAFGMYDDDRIEIYIDQAKWSRMNEVEKNATVFHELAHDMFNEEHVRGGCTLMAPNLAGSACGLNSQYLTVQMRKMAKKHDRKIKKIIKKNKK
tara:strand:- start:173 stop:736 length:564 start_codon:yes stop_codon:yes gene_type:complete